MNNQVIRYGSLTEIHNRASYKRLGLRGTVARQAKFRRALAPLLSRLPPEAAHALLGSVMALCSASGWESIRAVGANQSADGVAWSLEALIDHARAQGESR